MKPQTEEKDIRCFFAIALSDDTKNRMKEYIGTLKDYFTFCKVGWAREENLHITLWFLGHLPPRILQGVIEKAEPIFSSAPSFQFSFGEAGAFPNFKKPKALWIGLKVGGEKIINLKRGLDGALKGLPVQKDHKNYMPHITLGRVRALSANYKGEGVTGATLTKCLENNPITQKINEVLLLKSELHPQGSTYTVIKAFPLCGDTQDTADVTGKSAMPGRGKKNKKPSDSNGSTEPLSINYQPTTD